MTTPGLKPVPNAPTSTGATGIQSNDNANHIVWADIAIREQPGTVEVLVTVIAALLMLLALSGIIFPILPGSPVAIITMIAWAWIIGSTASWATGIIAAALALLGWSASLILTGRTMRRERIPSTPILIATAAAIVGLFIIPFFGIFIGFALGLFGAEYYRRRDPLAALRPGEALKATGIGLLVELGCIILAIAVFGVGVLIHFLTVV